MILINEATRREIMDLSKSGSKERFRRRVTVDRERMNIRRVGMLELTARSPHLDIYFEINSYKTSVRFRDFIQILQREYRTGQYSMSTHKEIRAMVENAFDFALNNSDIDVDCTCADFKYRFAYVATIKDFKLGKPENRPARKTNPNNEGSVCKHLTRVLNRPSDWKHLVVTAVVRTIKWDPTIITGELI